MSKATRGEPIMLYSEALGKDVAIGYRNEWDASGARSAKQHQETECANPDRPCDGCDHRPDCEHCRRMGVEG